MKETTCLIFDMDGTLWNAADSILKAGNIVIEKEKGWKNYLTREMLDSIMGLEIEEIANIYFPQLDQAERMSLTLKIMEYENEYLSHHGGILYQDVEETLKLLSKKYDLMIVTNAQDGYVEAMFDAHPLHPYFIDYETYGKTMRPKGENIRFIMERNGYEHAYYIGDTQKDLEACKFAEIPFIYASYGFGEVKEYDYKIDCFKELKEIFL